MEKILSLNSNMNICNIISLNSGVLLTQDFLDMELTFYPIALRIAKTLWSFGYSECKRLKYESTKT